MARGSRTRAGWARLCTAGALLVAATATTLVAPPPASAALPPVPGGPVIVDGNDPGDHVAQVSAYIANVYANLDANLAVSYVHNGQVAVIGTCDTILSGMGTGQTFVRFATPQAVDQLFGAIGANNYKHIHICSDDDPTLGQPVEDALDAWGSALVRHVNRGGGLFSTGHSYNWLADLFPALVVTPGGTSSSYVSGQGALFFPTLPADTFIDAINHYTFTGIETTVMQPLLSQFAGGGGLQVAIGGTTVRFPQIFVEGPAVGEVGTDATYTLLAATADGVLLSNTAFTWAVTGPASGPTSGSGVTDADGEFELTFSGTVPGETRVSVQMALGGNISAGASTTTDWVERPGAPLITGAVDVPGQSGAIRLSWNDPASDGGSPVTDYTIQRSADGGATWVTVADGLSTDRTYVVTGLNDAIPYRFRVAATNAVGTGAYSAAETQTSIGPPTAPDLTAATGTGNGVALSWEPPTSTNGAPVTGYVVQHSPAGLDVWTTLSPNPGASPATVPGLVAGVQYDFRVAALNSEGAGNWSNVRTASPQAPPDAVVDLQVDERDGTVVVTWEEPAFNGGAPVTGYQVSSIGGQTCAPEHVHLDGGSTHAWRCTFTGLPNGVAQTVTVAAVNAQGVGTPTSVTGTPTGLAVPPTVVVQPGDGELVVTWTDADGNGRPVTGYEIIVDGQVVATVPPDQHSYTVTGVLDTRAGVGARPGPLEARESLDVAVLGRGDVPAEGVAAVWMTLTSTGATEASYVRAWPTGRDWSMTSMLNTDVGVDTPNLVLVPVGQDGSVSFYNDRGRGHLVADVVGWIPVNGPAT